jgi:GDP-L-fucose synthase
MPTNLCGPGDNFERLDSYVIPAMIRKFHQAKVAGDLEMVVWGIADRRCRGDRLINYATPSEYPA